MGISSGGRGESVARGGHPENVRREGEGGAQVGPEEDREEKGLGRKIPSTGRGPGDRKPPERGGGVRGGVSDRRGFRT